MATRIIYPSIKPGQRFGRLTVLSETDRLYFPSGWATRRWVCICDCGNRTTVGQSALKHGKTQSCGCLRIERISTHRMSKTPIYKLWRGIQDRCYNPNDIHYEMYGARGIYMDDKWRNSFEAFASYISDNLGPRPPGYTLDRIDNEGPYAPGNVRWATPKQQATNRRNSIYVEWREKTIPLSDAARETGIPYGVVFVRLKRGWPLEQALMTPVRPTKRSS